MPHRLETQQAAALRGIPQPQLARELIDFVSGGSGRLSREVAAPDPDPAVAASVRHLSVADQLTNPVGGIPRFGRGIDDGQFGKPPSAEACVELFGRPQLTLRSFLRAVPPQFGSPILERSHLLGDEPLEPMRTMTRGHYAASRCQDDGPAMGGSVPDIRM
jgi:hypothetical protein